MTERLVPYRHNTFTDALVAVGTAALAEGALGVPGTDIEIHQGTDGFHIRHPEPADGSTSNPFFEVKDKEERETTTSNVLDRTDFKADDAKPDWWGTTSVVNTIATPVFNNAFAQSYTPEAGRTLLDESAEAFPSGAFGKPATFKRSALLYPPASKGAGGPNLGTGQSKLVGGDEQGVALLGYQQVGSGYRNEFLQPYTVSLVPRPREITLEGLRSLTGFLRGYLPRTHGGKVLPTKAQTVPYFTAMAYFDFVIELFAYRERVRRSWLGGVGRIVSGLDRALYFSLGSSSAPYALDSLAIPDWLDRRGPAANVRDVVRQTVGDHLDPALLGLPVRAFAEGEPRHLVRFYRQINPLARAFDEQKQGRGFTLLSLDTLTYVMDQTGYDDLNAEPVRRFARALRSRTIRKLYDRSTTEPPDFQLLNDLRSASLSDRRLINMLSGFVGSYNLRNARLSAEGKHAEGQNLSYDDLDVIKRLVSKYGAEFVANTLLAQAMSKRSEEDEPVETSDSAPAQPAAETA